MKKILSTILFTLCLQLFANAQRISEHSIKYMVSFDSTKKIYTAWLVPEYNTPNYNNPDTEEKGATAQVSLKVPKGFVLSELKSIKGGWDNAPSKLGTEDAFLKAGIDPNFEYYIIGKSPVETNYGEFKEGEPVALFTFKGSSLGEPSKVTALENNDKFVKIANETLSLNVSSSFYSRSGQEAKVTATPQEQFVKTTSLSAVLKNMTKKLTNENLTFSSEPNPSNVVIAYPNPITDEVNLKYFSESDEQKAEFYIVDLNGKELQQKDMLTKFGFNTVNLKLTNYVDGTYLIKTKVGNKVITKKIVKVQ